MAFDLDLTVVGTGVRDGAVNFGGKDWDNLLNPLERRDLEAFRDTGWNFTPTSNVLKLNDGNAKAPEAGLLARHPRRGLVIVGDKLVVGLAEGFNAEALKALHPEATPLLFGTNLHEIHFDVPADNLHGAVNEALTNLRQQLGAEAVRFAEPVLTYHMLEPESEDVPVPALAQPPALAPAGVSVPEPETGDDTTQWQWVQIKLRDAWAEGQKRGDGTRVAVIDSGFFPHAQLPIDAQVSISEKGVPLAAPLPGFWHGTFCAGLIGALRDDHFVNGAAPNCKLILISVGKTVRSTGIAAALNAGLEKDAHVISCSVAPAGGWDALDTVLDVVKDLHAKGRGKLGTLVVWATFNDNLPIDPKSLEGSGAVVCVAPSDTDDNRLTASGSGAALDLIAPGSAVSGLYCTSATSASISAESGASFAAPCVAGVAAVVLSVNPNLKLGELKDIITEKSCDPDVPGKTRQDAVGWGRLNALRAVKAAKAALPPPLVQ